jgi:adenylate cyclase class IV
MEKKNLEIKIRVDSFDKIKEKFIDYYSDLLKQKDTYYVVNDGRLKLRQEGVNVGYFIRYYRDNLASEKISKYYTYNIPNVEEFNLIFNNAMKTEVIIEKERMLYLYKNVRIHLDKIIGVPESKSLYVEIEVVIKNEEEDNKSNELMEELLIMMELKNSEVIALGYREIVLENKIQ